MKQYSILIAVAALGGLLVCGAAAQKNEANRLNDSSDGTFVKKAAQGGMAEVELGNLASERASNPRVKEFGQRMVTDHTKANDELKALASSKGISTPSGIDSEARAEKRKLSRLHGKEFDRVYMQNMVSDHQKDIADFQREADHGGDPDVRSFASKTLPTLQEHLRLAQSALAEVNK